MEDASTKGIFYRLTTGLGTALRLMTLEPVVFIDGACYWSMTVFMEVVQMEKICASNFGFSKEVVKKGVSCSLYVLRCFCISWAMYCVSDLVIFSDVRVSLHLFYCIWSFSTVGYNSRNSNTFPLVFLFFRCAPTFLPITRRISKCKNSSASLRFTIASSFRFSLFYSFFLWELGVTNTGEK